MTTKLAAGVALILILAGQGSQARVFEEHTRGILRASSSAGLQAALDRAIPGQTILLDAGRTYEGPFRLPDKEGDGWITIKTAVIEARVMPEGTRVGPDDARWMAKLTSARGSVIETAPGAHHYRFVGLEFAPAPGVALTDLVHLGTDSPDPAAIPHHFVIERSYFRGDPAAGTRRGIALNSADTVVRDSYFADFKEAGQDSQAICGWNGPGPFRILNNYLEAAGENLMFGGGDPTVNGLVPSDIEIRRNHFTKPVEWRREPGPGEPQWTIKNLLELKNARRVVIEGNVFEHSWLQAQVGFAILFTPRNQDGKSPWSVVEDVVFRNNLVRRAAAGVNIIGWDDIHQSRQTQRLSITNNLFTEIGGPWGFGRLFQLLNGTADVTIEHNTATQTETAVFGGDTLAHTGFVFRNNIVPHNEYGFIGSNFGSGRTSIEHYFPDADIRGNVIAGGDPAIYPADNYFPPSLADVGFSDPEAGRFDLSRSSPYLGRATDGSNVGADLDVLARAIEGVVQTEGRGSAGSGRQKGKGAAAFWFWLAGALLAYTYVGYPAFIWVTAGLARRPPAARPYQPSVSIVVVAHNEAARIGARVRNLLELDYPKGRTDIVVVSDGSTDETAAIARAAGAPVRVIEFARRRGKAAVFDDVLPALSSEVIVLADARQRFHPGAVTRLVANLADPAVGAVSGDLVLADAAGCETGCQGVGLYWSLEKRLRWWESQADSSIGATGAIMALRRELFEPIPPDTVLDDVLIPLRIARRGFRVTFDPRAHAFDHLSVTDREEFCRKARTLAGNFQLFAREPWLLLPWKNRLWLQTISHKGLRLALPVLAATVLASNVFLLDSPFYRLTLAAQLAFYALAIAGGFMPALRARARWLVIPYTICFLFWATLVGFARFVTGRQLATWDRHPTAA